MLKAAVAKKTKPSPTWYSCSWPDYVGDQMCEGVHNRTEPCVPLHDIAKHCNSARMYDDISDSWNQPLGNGCGVKQIIEFWAANPQLATLRNELPEAQTYYNDPDQLLIGGNGLSKTEAEVQQGMWALWSAPMVLSVELRNKSLSAEMSKILLNKEVLAVADDPLGRQATLCVHHGCQTDGILYNGGTTIWNKTLADGGVALGTMIFF
jgi:hypothetical protein